MHLNFGGMGTLHALISPEENRKNIAPTPRWEKSYTSEHCFKNSLVIAIMFRVALGN
jgi:hypothetical protein